MNKFTCAVIGLGNIGMLYDLAHKEDYVLSHVKAYMDNPLCRLSFGVDIDPARRKLFEKATRRPAYENIEQAKKAHGDVDIVSICVHVEDRMKVVSQALSLKPKLIFLEKPIARSVRDARRIIAMCKKRNVPICVNYIRRFEKNTYIIKEAIDGKIMGRFLYATVAYNRGFFNNGSHYIDLMLALLGKPSGFKLVRKSKSGRDYDVDLIMEFPGGEVHFKTVKTGVPICEIDLWFERGRIEYKKFGNEITYHCIRKDPVYTNDEELTFRKKIVSEMPYVMRHAVDNICSYLLGKGKLLSTEKNALDALKLCERIVKQR